MKHPKIIIQISNNNVKADSNVDTNEQNEAFVSLHCPHRASVIKRHERQGYNTFYKISCAETNLYGLSCKINICACLSAARLIKILQLSY